MSRTISAALKTHFEGESTTIATCWKLTRVDGTIMGFTDHVENITFSSQLYVASTGFQPTDVMQRDDLSVDNMELTGILDSSYITEADIQAGLYDFAEIEIFLVNYEDLSQGRLWIKRGWIGEVRFFRGQFQAEIRGLAQKLSQNIGRLFGPSCDAILGDSRCGVTVGSFTDSTTVSSVDSNQVFTCASLSRPNGYFQGGEVIWTGGSNNGLKMEVKEQIDDTITLVLPMSNAVQIGDTVSIIAGCNKSAAACKSKFNNYLNFRGFPDLPGQDRLLETSGTRTTEE